MAHACDHALHKTLHHIGWNNANPPALKIAPGETVAFETVDSSGGQLAPGSTVEDLGRLDFIRVNPVTGPVFVDGAEPGDALRIRILDMTPSGWGWTANIPGFGLLADQFPDPALHMWTYDTASMAPAAYGPGGRVPLKPFCGTIGLAPAAEGIHSIVPPRRVGGNMDVRDIGVGTELWLPVEVAGALFSVGDTHAAQGDGEVCGTAIESPMSVAIAFELEKGLDLRFPRFRTEGPVSRDVDAKGYDVTTGIGEDLMAAARDAVSGMIDLLARRTGMSAVEAYMLASVAGDLRISEIVDAPNWVVSFYFPRIVLE
jgi:acetamidase/formamidase